MKTRLRTISLLLWLLLCCRVVAAQPSLHWVQTPRLVSEQAGKLFWATFELDQFADVEVAIVDPATSRVVRHLAAGALGANPPPPLVANSRAQRIAWDGQDDYGQPIADPAKLAVRVRAGLSVKLDRIVGGDPHAYWSEDSGQGDHAQWMVTGLEAKPDGNVYVLGNSTFYGGPALRQFNARGDYLRTVFPPPAGRPVDEMRGWGINVRADGTYTLQSRSGWAHASPSKTLISRGGQALCASLVPTLANDTLCLASIAGRDFGNQQMTMPTDGTLPKYQVTEMLSGKPLPRGGLAGNLFSALSVDGKSLFISGLYASDDAQRIQTTGFWRDAQVWKVDLETRTPQVFFALDEKDVIGSIKSRSTSPIGHTSANPYAAFQGVATDVAGHVFVADRQNQRLVVLDARGTMLREIPVAAPDAVAVCPNSRTVYVTTRFGDYGGKGELKLLKINDWSQDDARSITVPLRSGIGKFRENSHLAVVENQGDVLVWVAYTTLPVRVYRDAGARLELVKDFYAASPRQRALDLQHMEVDQATGDVYFADAQGFCFRIRDWNDPQFELCRQDAQTPLRASSLAIDARHRHIYTHYQWGTPVYRWAMAGEFFVPAPAGELTPDRIVTIPGRPVPSSGQAHAITPPIACSWIFTGLGERGIAVAARGGLATLGVLPDKQNRADDYSGPLHFFHPNVSEGPWRPLRFQNFGGKQPRSGGVRFDLRGNLYVGLHDGQITNVPAGFAQDPDFKTTTGRIYKFAATGADAAGNLFPREPEEPAKIYDIHYGPLGQQSRTPRFGVDGYGRIYFPTGSLPQVSVIDNAGNRLVAFGTYGNRDSLGGLPGDLVPTKDIPLAWPNSVDATDDYIFVSDITNVRLLRIKKNFALSASSKQ